MRKIRELTDQIEINKILKKHLKKENKACKKSNAKLVKENEKLIEEIGKLKRKNDYTYEIHPSFARSFSQKTSSP